MQLSASIELIWNFAVREAIESDHKDIEPEHVLEALLKFAELRPDELRKIAPGSEVAGQLAREASDVRRNLTTRGIDATATPRKLRRELGNGKHVFDGGLVNRAQATRDLFDDAARLGDDEGGQTVAALPVLRALLKRPTALIRNVVGDTQDPPARDRDVSPLLKALGPVAGSAKQTGDSGPAAARAKVLAGILRSSPKRMTLLIGDSDSLARRAFDELAVALASGGEEFKTVRTLTLLDLTAGQGKQLREALEQAASRDDLVLLLPSISAEADWAGFLKRFLVEARCHSLMFVEAAMYHAAIERDTEWRRLADAVWVHALTEREIPREI